MDEVRPSWWRGVSGHHLLGQNVNSYGKDLGLEIDFADLLARIDAIPGDFFVRFMTSHPGRLEKLFETMAPVPRWRPSSTCLSVRLSRVLKAMNRHYDRETYLDEVRRPGADSPTWCSPAT